MTHAIGKRPFDLRARLEHWRSRLDTRVGGEMDATIGAYADALFPPGGPIPVSGSDAGAVEFMRSYLHRSQPRQRRLVELLIVASEMGPLAFGRRRARFTSLEPNERQEFIREGFASRIYLRRVIVVTMRALLTMAYFADARVLAHIGMTHDRDPFGMDTPPAPLASEVRVSGATDDDLEGVA